MKTNKKLLPSIEDYKKTSSINSMKLIRLVRNNSALYNSSAEGYNDKNHKELVWEKINQTLFPKYNTLDKRIKEIVRNNVKRRWKTLRNAIAREVKKAVTFENYCRKKESPMITELEFLIPHIRSIHCSKFSEEMEARENAEENYLNDDDAIDDEDEEQEERIDLTEEMDMKPNIKLDSSLSLGSPEIVVNNIPTEALYPSVQLHCSGGSYNTSGTVMDNTVTAEPPQPPQPKVTSTPIWSTSEYCAVAEYKEGEFMNSTVLCPDQDSDNDTSPPVVSTSCNIEDKPNDLKKCDKSDLEDPAELQAKILQLLSNLERRERSDMRLDQEAHDEDRMFLLSLVSDLKRVPAAKKMLVKAEIATTIARAIQ